MKFVCDDQRHLICEPWSITGLHAMATELGLGFWWFHKTHYDMPKGRVADIMARCRVVRPREIVRIIREGQGRAAKQLAFALPRAGECEKEAMPCSNASSPPLDRGAAKSPESRKSSAGF